MKTPQAVKVEGFFIVKPTQLHNSICKRTFLFKIDEMKYLVGAVAALASFASWAQAEHIEIVATDSVVVMNDGDVVRLYGEGSTVGGFYSLTSLNADFIEINKSTGELHCTGVHSFESIGLTVQSDLKSGELSSKHLYYNKGDDTIYLLAEERN